MELYCRFLFVSKNEKWKLDVHAPVLLPAAAAPVFNGDCEVLRPARASRLTGYREI